jgi:putative transposase
VNQKRVLRVMRERGLLVRSRRLRARRKKEWGRRGSSRAESNLAVGHDENLGGSYSGLGVPGVRDRLLHAGDRGLASLASLPNRRCSGSGRTSGARTAARRQPWGELDGTQSTSSRFLETLGRLGITHRRTAYHHPEGNSYIERFHRSLKEEEVWTAEYRSLEEARASIARWIKEYNHDRPHRGVGNNTPHEAFLAFANVLKNEALTV